MSSVDVTTQLNVLHLISLGVWWLFRGSQVYISGIFSVTPFHLRERFYPYTQLHVDCIWLCPNGKIEFYIYDILLMRATLDAFVQPQGFLEREVRS